MACWTHWPRKSGAESVGRLFNWASRCFDRPVSRESAFIEALKAIATHPGARGLNDDTAVLVVGDTTLVLTHDMIAQGVHYLPDSAPEDVAWKLVSVNMSDLAAKGARPVAVMLGYCLGSGEWDAAFLAGLGQALDHYGAPLLGGDSISLPPGAPRVLGLTAIGEAVNEAVPHRGGARAGDWLYVTGTIGDAMMGHRIATCGGDYRNDELLCAYNRPQARLSEGRALAPLVHAMMDVSDGLLIDARRMAVASGVGVDIDFAAVPFSDAFISAGRAMEQGNSDDLREVRNAALRWGDDYQLLFAAPPGFESPVPATFIGRFAAGMPSALSIDGVTVPEDAMLGYEHG